MADRQLRFLLIGKDKSASKTLNKVGKEADGLGKKIGGLGKSAALGLAGIGTAAGVGLIGVLGKSVGAASDLGETLSKVNNVFGDSAKEIRTWSKSSARSFGLSQEAALAAAGQFGDMFIQLGFTKKAAVASSKDLVKLAADLGSFHNLDTADVLERIGGALRGEFDSIQALIPNINAARVENEALAATGKKTAAELTAQEKAAATLAIVMKDSANATNDFAETSGGLAGQQKILKASLDDTMAQIGQGLLPVMTSLATYANDHMVPAVQGFVTEFENGTGRGGEFKAAMTDLGVALEAARPQFEQFASTLGNIAGAAGTALKGVKEFSEFTNDHEKLWGGLQTLVMGPLGALTTKLQQVADAARAAKSAIAALAGVAVGGDGGGVIGGPAPYDPRATGGTGMPGYQPPLPNGLTPNGGRTDPPKGKPGSKDAPSKPKRRPDGSDDVSRRPRGNVVRGNAALPPQVIRVVLPNGKVLAEVVNNARAGMGARGAVMP